VTPADLVLGHLRLLKMSHEQMAGQIAALEEFVKALQAPPKTARVELPEFCSGLPDRLCALRCEDARIDKASLAHPHRFMCRGCGAGSEDGITVVK
jgi:hypothetical protein